MLEAGMEQEEIRLPSPVIFSDTEQVDIIDHMGPGNMSAKSSSYDFSRAISYSLTDL